MNWYRFLQKKLYLCGVNERRDIIVSDTLTGIGKVTVATAKMPTANKGKSRLGASVSIKFSQEFASNVSWQKIDERTGAEIPDEDIIDGGGDSPADGGGGELEP